MSKLLLLEDTLGEFIVDRSKGHKGIIIENVQGGSPLYRVPGRFSVCNVRNGNNRRYPLKVWENNLKSDSKLRRLIEKNAAFGLLEHPSDGRVSLSSPIAVITTKADLVADKEDTVVEGELVIVNTAEGQKLRALIEAGYNPFVSSRGYGSLTSVDGVDEVQDDFVCEGWDVVYQPSFETAELRPPRVESPQAESRKPAPSQTPPSGSSGPVPVPSSTLAESKTPTNHQQTSTMAMKDIRVQLDAVKASISGKLDPRQLSETLTRCDQLHRDVSDWKVEDPKRDWDATRLHEEIKGIEERLAAIQTAPAQELTKVRESHHKLLQVTKLAAQKAVQYRQKLGESMVLNGKVKALSTKLLERGRVWKTRAESLQDSRDEYDFQLDIVSEALEMLVGMYNTDVVKLSRKLMAQKFGEAMTDDFKKRMAKATHPQELYSIYEELTEASKADDDDEDDEAEKAKKAKAKKDKEANESQKPGKPGKPAANGKPPLVEVKLTAVRDPRSLTESIEIAKRLSTALVTA